MRPLPPRKSAILSVLDIGTSKIVCLIARLTPTEPSETLRGRTHRCKMLGIGHQRSRGIKGGAVVDMEAAEQAIRLAVDAAERMAGVEVGGVIVNMSGGRLGSRLYRRQGRDRAAEPWREDDIHRVLEAGSRARRARRAGRCCTRCRRLLRWTRRAAFAIRAAWSARNSASTCMSSPATPRRAQPDAGGRTLPSRVEAMVATPYAAGLSALVDDEAEIGAALDRHGRRHDDGRRVLRRPSDPCRRVRGRRQSRDDGHRARPQRSSVADAERLKTLYGGCIASASDERETIAVPSVGEDEASVRRTCRSRSWSRIIRPRVEEILELVRDRLKNAGFAAQAGRRLVLTGGACQLTGLPEAGAHDHLQAGAHRPAARRPGAARIRQEPGLRRGGRSAGLSAGGAASSISSRGARGGCTATGTDGYIARVGRWLKESF